MFLELLLRINLILVIILSGAHASIEIMIGSPPQFKPLTPPGTYTSYIVGAVCRPTGEIVSPTTTAQLKSIVNSAISKGQKVKAFGNRHSTTDIICTHGIAIDMGNFKERMELDHKDHKVTVSAGFTVRELGFFLHSKGRALEGGPAYGEISISGAMGTGAHGSSLITDSTLSSQVVRVKFIDGLGQIQTTRDPEDLKGWRVHLGVLGIIIEVTLRTVPDYKVRGYNYRVSDDLLTNGLWEGVVRSHDFAELQWFPASKTVVVLTGTKVPATTPGEAYCNILPASTPAYNLQGKLSLEGLQAIDNYVGLSTTETLTSNFLTQKTPGLAPFYTDDGDTFLNPAVGWRYLMLDSVCYPNCLWHHSPNNITWMDVAIALPTKDLPQIINTVKNILSLSPATFQLVGIAMRFGLSSQSFMATNNGRETVYFEFVEVRRHDLYETSSSGLPAYQAIIQALVSQYGGRTHWGKNGLVYIGREWIQRKVSVKNLNGFKALMDRWDPNQLFLNDFANRLLNRSDTINKDPRTTHCALQDNCICKIGSDCDCAPGQMCTMLFNYPVCRNVLLGSIINEKLNVKFSNLMEYFIDFVRRRSTSELVQ